MARTYYIWDEVDDTLLMETDEAGNKIAEYTHEPGLYGPLISQRRNGHTYYHHYDGQGSTRALTDEFGNVTDRYTYTAFGEPVATSGATTNPFGYKGSLGYYINPDTSDLYVRARRYLPAIGRWLSVDPVLRSMPRLLPVLARTSHEYGYSANSPVVQADPSGLLCCGVDKADVKPGKCGFFGDERYFGQIHEAYYRFKSGDGYDCKCCEFRQYIRNLRGTLRMRDSHKVDLGNIETLLHPEWEEDNEEMLQSDRQTRVTQRYGHRERGYPQAGDCYYPGEQASACGYYMFDLPGKPRMRAVFRELYQRLPFGAQVQIHVEAEFRLKIIQVGRGECGGGNRRFPAVRDVKNFKMDCESEWIIGVPSSNGDMPRPDPSPIATALS